MALDWFYNEGDIVGNLKLLDKTIIVQGKKYLRKRPAWICKCMLCGNTTIKRVADLKASGPIADTACGDCCERMTHINLGNKARTHGMTGTRLHRIWKNMKNRCRGTADTYTNSRYAERGIKICDEWANSFESFCDWAMTNGYEDNLEIDRIDNDKGYSPDNCRWLTHKENCRNRPQYKGT